MQLKLTLYWGFMTHFIGVASSLMKRNSFSQSITHTVTFIMCTLGPYIWNGVWKTAWKIHHLYYHLIVYLSKGAGHYWMVWDAYCGSIENMTNQQCWWHSTIQQVEGVEIHSIYWSECERWKLWFDIPKKKTLQFVTK